MNNDLNNKASSKSIWTEEQLKAINANSGNFLVSASAGSGKTAVLTERVFRLLKEGTKIDSFLVLTFTNKAANEMRDRIRDKLISSGDYEIATNLDASNIQTFDAFALSTVKKYHYLLDVPSSIGVVDESILTIEKRRIIDKLFDDLYEQNDDLFKSFVYVFSVKNDTNLKDFFLEVDNVFDYKLDKEEYISKYLDTYFDQNKVNSYLSFFTSQIIDDYLYAIDLAKQMENATFSSSAIEYLSNYLNAKTLDEIIKTYQNDELSYPTSKKKENKLNDSDKALNKIIKDLIKKNSYVTNYESGEYAIKEYMDTKPFVSLVLDIEAEFHRRISNFKKENSAYTFQDIAKLCLKALNIKDVSSYLSKKFQYIMIDEYQDTSDIQEEVINKLMNNNVYVVGDIKQSIYRFRNANCDLFMEKYNSYKIGQNGQLIELSKNFRSRPEVICDVNLLFSSLMQKPRSDYNYASGHAMLFGNKEYETIGKTSNNSHFEYLVYNKENDPSLNEQDYIAYDIINKINSGYQIYDGKAKTTRPCRFSDFAILIDRKTKFGYFQRTFNKLNIPLKADYDFSIKENDVTLVFKNIISLIELKQNNDYNPSFIHNLVGILRSFLFSYSDQSIYDIVHEKKFLECEITPLIDDIILYEASHSLSDTVAHILSIFHFYDRLILLGDITMNLNILDYIYQIALQMENIGYRLGDFISYFNDLDEYTIEPKMDNSEVVENAVRLMTIHASKGLQFKIVYYSSLSTKPRQNNYANMLSCDGDYGIHMLNMNCHDATPFITRIANSKNKVESIKEKLRVLYVALTRAEEKAILVVSSKVFDSFGSPMLFENATKLSDFLRISSTNFPFREASIKYSSLSARENIDKEASITLYKNDIKTPDVFKKIYASKTESDGVDSELLSLGNRYHYYLELVDFETKDTSFIKDEKDRKIIDCFLQNSLFKDLSGAKILHEYPFSDEISGINGVIDLLLIFDNHADIVDFKLSHIDDKLYDRQVGIYANYIKRLLNVPIHAYITSIRKGLIREVELDG